jgi:prevent-host-death family protein
VETLQVSSEQARRQLSDLLSQVSYGGVQVIIERYGKPIAVLSPYVPVSTETAESEEFLAPFEQVPRLTRQLQQAAKEAGVSYETLSEALQAERLKTLREKYPEFAERYVPTEPA